MIEKLIEIGNCSEQYVSRRVKEIRNVREEAREIIIHLNSQLREMRELVVYGEFDSPADEIRFFKEIKPRLCSHLIYFGYLKYLSNKEPITSIEVKRQFFEEELTKIQTDQSIEPEISHYFGRGLTHYDSLYFIRGAVDAFDLPSSVKHVFDRDERFYTQCDQDFATLMARPRIKEYLRERLALLKQDELTERFLGSEPSPIRWTKSKRGLVELLLLLFEAKCFNQGEVEKKTLVRVFEYAFNIQLGDFYDICRKIRNRKKGASLFLEKLIELKVEN